MSLTMLLPEFGAAAGHMYLLHGVYVEDMKQHKAIAAAHVALHYAQVAPRVPHTHSNLTPAPTIAPARVEHCGWCDDPINAGEPIWWHVAGPVHAWHPGRRP